MRFIKLLCFVLNVSLDQVSKESSSFVTHVKPSRNAKKDNEMLLHTWYKEKFFKVFQTLSNNFIIKQVLAINSKTKETTFIESLLRNEKVKTSIMLNLFNFVSYWVKRIGALSNPELIWLPKSRDSVEGIRFISSDQLLTLY